MDRRVDQPRRQPLREGRGAGEIFQHLSKRAREEKVVSFEFSREPCSLEGQLTKPTTDESELVLRNGYSKVLKDEGALGSRSSGGVERSSISRPSDGLNHSERQTSGLVLVESEKAFGILLQRTAELRKI